MRTFEMFISSAMMLILVFLVLTNAPQFARVMAAFGDALNDTFRTLQGRTASP